MRIVLISTLGTEPSPTKINKCLDRVESDCCVIDDKGSFRDLRSFRALGRT